MLFISLFSAFTIQMQRKVVSVYNPVKVSLNYTTLCLDNIIKMKRMVKEDSGFPIDLWHMVTTITKNKDTEGEPEDGFVQSELEVTV